MICEVIFDLDGQQKELQKIEKIMSKADFWQKDQEEISKLNQQSAFLREKIDQWKKYYQETEDAKILAEMAHEENDQSTLKEVEKDEVTDEEEERGNDRGVNLKENFQELMKRLKNIKVKIIRSKAHHIPTGVTDNFRSFYLSMSTLWRACTGESWNDIFHECYKKQGFISVFYWITF